MLLRNLDRRKATTPWIFEIFYVNQAMANLIFAWLPRLIPSFLIDGAELGPISLLQNCIRPKTECQWQRPYLKTRHSFRNRYYFIDCKGKHKYGRMLS